jgi:hypothetical protein
LMTNFAKASRLLLVILFPSFFISFFNNIPFQLFSEVGPTKAFNFKIYKFSSYSFLMVVSSISFLLQNSKWLIKLLFIEVCKYCNFVTAASSIILLITPPFGMNSYRVHLIWKLLWM